MIFVIDFRCEAKKKPTENFQIEKEEDGKKIVGNIAISYSLANKCPWIRILFEEANRLHSYRSHFDLQAMNLPFPMNLPIIIDRHLSFRSSCCRYAERTFSCRFRHNKCRILIISQYLMEINVLLTLRTQRLSMHFLQPLVCYCATAAQPVDKGCVTLACLCR